MKPKYSAKKKCLFISSPNLSLAEMRELLGEYSLINAGYPEAIEMDSDTYAQWVELFTTGAGMLSMFHGIPVRELKL